MCEELTHAEFLVELLLEPPPHRLPYDVESWDVFDFARWVKAGVGWEPRYCDDVGEKP